MSNVETLQPGRLKQQVRPGDSPLVLDLPNEETPNGLVDALVTIILAKAALREYNGLPKGNSTQRKIANDLVTKTATELLKNPQDITIAQTTWRGNEPGVDGAQEPQEPFSKKVKEKMLTIIKDEWEDVMPAQLAGLVRIYANKDESQESTRKFAEVMLKNYFKGPESRNQRIGAYYTFVSATLDLVGEDEAFREGMKIALHATDILPKDPSLTDQTLLVSLPDKEEEGLAFKQTLVVNYVIGQLRFMKLKDFERYYQDRKDFVESPKVQGKFREKQYRVAKEIGSDKTRELNNKMLIFFCDVTEPLSEETKQSLKDTWPHSVAFDENDPLNHKFNRILAENRSNSGESVEPGLRKPA